MNMHLWNFRTIDALTFLAHLKCRNVPLNKSYQARMFTPAGVLAAMFTKDRLGIRFWKRNKCTGTICLDEAVTTIMFASKLLQKTSMQSPWCSLRWQIVSRLKNPNAALLQSFCAACIELGLFLVKVEIINSEKLLQNLIPSNSLLKKLLVSPRSVAYVQVLCEQDNH